MSTKWNDDKADELLDLGLRAMRNNIATSKQVEEAASRVFRNLTAAPDETPSLVAGPGLKEVADK